MNLGMVTDRARVVLVENYGDSKMRDGFRIAAAGMCARCYLNAGVEVPATVAGIFDPDDRTRTGPCPFAYCEPCASAYEARGYFTPLDGAR